MSLSFSFCARKIYSFLWSFLPQHFNCEQDRDMKANRHFSNKHQILWIKFCSKYSFFFFSDCFMFPISQLMEKRLRNEIWHIPCGIKDTLKKYLNDYWHWNAKQLKFFLSGLGKKKLISCKFFSRFLLFCNFSIDLCLRIEEGSFIRC